MACEFESIPQSCDVAIANAMAIAIAMSNPQVYSMFRDSFSIINDSFSFRAVQSRECVRAEQSRAEQSREQRRAESVSEQCMCVCE